MTTTITPKPTSDRALAPARIVGGIGGLTFVASVILQNALRAEFPPNDASAGRIAAYYADHRGISIAFAVLFPIGALGIATFLGAVLQRVGSGHHRGAAFAGAFGATGIIATFTMLVATDLGLGGYVHRGHASPQVVGGLWVLHNAIFGVLLAWIGIALAGLTAASAASGLLPNWWKALGLLGAVLLLIAAATTPLIIDASPTMLIGLLGFLVWVAYVTVTSVTLLRRNNG